MNGLDIIKGVLPFIGTALGGPIGGGLATFLSSKLGIPDSTVEGVKTAITGMLGNPELNEKLQEAELASKEHCIQMGYDSIQKLEELNASVVLAVNTTMQVEAKADHWPTYTWRPFIGFIFGFYIISIGIAPYFHITPVFLPSEMTMAIGGILGIASFFRGKAQADPNVNTDNRG